MNHSSPAPQLVSLLDEIFLLLREDLSTDPPGRGWVNQLASASSTPYEPAANPLDDAITVLCQLAMADESEKRRLGLHGLFSVFVEPMSDSFDPANCSFYDHTFAQVVDFCRKHPAGARLDLALHRFALSSKIELIQRKEALRRQPPFERSKLQAIRKCFVLSRVTLGGDVAITSVVIKKLSEVCPNAEIILIGDRQLEAIFFNLPRFRLAPCQYHTHGPLINRLESWLEILPILELEIGQLPNTAYLVVDPDSRLTQLGLLPVIAHDEQYLFFESRAFQQAGQQKISVLTAIWLNHHFGGEEVLPFVSLPPSSRQYAQAMRTRLAQRASCLTSVALGVGGNEKKRVSFDFELALLKQLLRVQGNQVLLFKGVSAAEKQRTSALLGELHSALPIQSLELAGNDLNAIPENAVADLIAWEGPLGEYCALIAQSDIHVGYDSSNQHIAAALGRPTIDIFADQSTPMVLERWTPHGPGQVRVIRAFDKSRFDASLAEILAAFHSLLPQTR